MNNWHRFAPPFLLCASLSQSSGAAEFARALTNEQQRAVGLRVAHPIAAQLPERIEALGLVLDATTLVFDVGEMTVAKAAEHSASAQRVRLHGLYEAGGGASLKMIEAAEAELTKSKAQVDLVSARFALHWGPLASMPPGARHEIVAAAATGHCLLVRADLPGRHSLGALPARTVLDVDGIQVPGRVLGALRQSGDVQSAGLLIEVQNAPAGFGPGARVPVALITAARNGLSLPRDALLYDEHGAYVYKQLTPAAGEQKTRYAAVKVTLLGPSGEGWLVDGVDDDDNIVVQGAGVLWSLQEVSSAAADDD